jgi:hypothetical protein
VSEFVFLARIMADVSQKEQDAKEMAERFESLCLGDLDLALKQAKIRVEALTKARNLWQAKAAISNARTLMVSADQATARAEFREFARISDTLASALLTISMLEARQQEICDKENSKETAESESESETPSSPLEYFELVMKQALQARKEYKMLDDRVEVARGSALISGVDATALEAVADRIRLNHA